MVYDLTAVLQEGHGPDGFTLGHDPVNLDLEQRAS